MRLLIDASGSSSGGVRRYVSGLLAAWSRRASNDELHVLCTQRIRSALAPFATTHSFQVGPLERYALLYHKLPGLVDELRPDALLATVPLLPVRKLSVPVAVTVHDIRHEIRPQEFSYARRLARRFEYSRAYRSADRLLAISARTRDDLATLHPELNDKVHVVPLGVDAEQFASMSPERITDGRCLAFAHHVNKRPELAVAAWVCLHRSGVELPLTIVGASDAQRTSLVQQATDAGLPQGVVTVTGPLSEREFAALWRGVNLVLMPSTFEGFGLPVLEGLARGIPVITSADPALLEVGAGHTYVARLDTPSDYADQVKKAITEWSAALARAWREHALGHTWDRTVSGTRDALAELV